eukprot:CAMPEP_0172824762 /NCGR_PEP_ID=MMETSP1075-20121228/18217_1 /TAXON_ID=2916 /ORGANISM="Ceratium fusus, Strain PA161109" /LENGTH=1226 /DNA_ID=CAMNT_0013666099 /DNA_START=21 /DNA_END=3697 /DNA_ORIENTATION=-
MESASQEGDLGLFLPGRLIDEALAQDEQQLCLDEICAPKSGSANYDMNAQQFKVEHITSALPAAFREPPDRGFMRHGVLPEIRHLWRSFESDIILWRYDDPRAHEVIEYRGVTQHVVSLAVARPKQFMTGVDYFLVISTPVEVSLHALRFAPGSDRLMPLARTPYTVATDDVVVSAIASHSNSGRIFLGGNDGCIHEFQYFHNEASWFRPAKRSRKSVVKWTFQSRLPAFLKKVTEVLFGPTESITQLVVDADRGLLFALSSCSSISVFQIPVAQETMATCDLAPLSHLCSLSTHSLSNEVARIRAQHYPGLSPSNGQGLGGFGVGTVPGTSQLGYRQKLVKLLPLSRSQGGSVLLCVVAEDGTRIFLRGVTGWAHRLSSSSLNEPNKMSTASTGDSAFGSGRGTSGSSPQISGLAVYHVRFLDVSCPGLRVRDAIDVFGNTLLLAQICSHTGVKDLAGRLWGAGNRVQTTLEHTEGDVMLALSDDLRAVAQRQSRGRSPWLAMPLGLAEHASVISLDRSSAACQVMAVADFSSRLPQALELLYDSAPSNGIILPVSGLSELAKGQLLPSPRLLLVSNLGIHVLTKIQPLDVLRQSILKRDMPHLRDFAQQYTQEQMCAMCFQILTTTSSSPLQQTEVGSRLAAARNGVSRMAASGGTAAVQRKAAFGMPGYRSQLQQQQQRSLEPLASLSPWWSEHDEAMMLANTEQLVLNPQLAVEMGFVQAWPSLDARTTQFGSALGHSIQVQEIHRVSGRLRGLCLYLSRILRPLWLTSIMTVTWPPQSSEIGRSKRRRDDWWPPAPEPPPTLQGSHWRCTWSKTQRLHLHCLLHKLGLTLDRIRNAGSMALRSSASDSLQDGALAGKLSFFVQTAMDGLAFLDLVASRAEILSTSPCPQDVLVRFSQLTFRDLVCQPEARKILQQLMRGGIVICRQLHANCPQLFSVVDLEVQEACELLNVAQESMGAGRSGRSMVDTAQLSQLVQRALRTLKRHAAKVNLEEVAAQLRMIGAYKGLIGLCAHVARARDPRDESLHFQDPTSSRVQQLHYARLECYQVVLELLDDLLARAQRYNASSGAAVIGMAPALLSGLGKGGPTSDGMAGGAPFLEVPELLPFPVADADAMRLLDAFLRHCLEGQSFSADELFHFCILKWTLQRELPVYRYNSPYLKGFLERHAKDRPDLLCHYFQHRRRWAEACDAYVALARASGVRSSQERCVFLQSAAVCAQMP